MGSPSARQWLFFLDIDTIASMVYLCPFPGLCLGHIPLVNAITVPIVDQEQCPVDYQTQLVMVMSDSRTISSVSPPRIGSYPCDKASVCVNQSGSAGGTTLNEAGEPYNLLPPRVA